MIGKLGWYNKWWQLYNSGELNAKTSPPLNSLFIIDWREGCVPDHSHGGVCTRSTSLWTDTPQVVAALPTVNRPYIRRRSNKTNSQTKVGIYQTILGLQGSVMGETVKPSYHCISQWNVSHYICILNWSVLDMLEPIIERLKGPIIDGHNQLQNQTTNFTSCVSPPYFPDIDELYDLQHYHDDYQINIYGIMLLRNVTWK